MRTLPPFRLKFSLRIRRPFRCTSCWQYEHVLMRQSQSSQLTFPIQSLNQWALDFQGNLQRIIESIQKAKLAGGELNLVLI
jgi:hypothetical protein